LSPGDVAVIEDAVSLTNILSLSPLTTPPQGLGPTIASYHERHESHEMPRVLLQPLPCRRCRRGCRRD
jgi:hypothetical protein